MTDELAPFFESRETRLGRLPAEARSKLQVAAQTVPVERQADYEDRQFVSLWLSRRVGLPRKDVLDNFDKIAARFFGEGATAGGAYDAIAATYKPPGEPVAEPGAAPVAEKDDAEYVATDGLARVGKGFFGEMRETAGQSARSVMAGFTGYAQQTPAGLYSQAAALTGAPALPSPMANPEYAALKKQTEQIINPYQFTEVSSNEPGVSGAGFEGVENNPIVKANEARMTAIVREMDADYRAKWKAWADSQRGEVSQEFRRLSDFWYKLSDGAMDRWGVTPEFRQTTIGQFMASAGSVPATAALAVMGPGGWVGMESAFYAQVEGERREAQGAAYDPDAALPANLAAAIPQLVLERALGVERLLNGVLKELPKQAGKVRFGDFAKIVARQSLTSAVEEGVENPTQGAWNDYMASLTYDEKREVLTGEGAKRRLVEGVSGFILGGMFGGVVSTAGAVDQSRRINAGAEYLTTKDGQPYSAADFNLLRSVKTDQDILAQAPDVETGRVLLAAANGDKAAQADYNKRTLDRLFVKTEGEEVGGLALGQINGVPVVKMADGTIIPLDMTQAEDQAFVGNVKKEVARQLALKETVGFLQKGLEAGREVEISEQERTLQDFINESKVNVDEAAARIGIANDVNAANLPEGVKPEDVRVLGANVAEYQQGVYRDVSTIYQGGTALTAVEEVAEGYIKKRLAVGDVFEADVAAWRAAYEADTGTTTGTKGKTSDIEWFSKRVVDYAVANRKAPGMPASLNSFFRTLGEHLKTVFRLAQRLARLKRSGKLDPNFENHLKAALGMMTTEEVATARTQAGRAARQAELEEAFAGLDTTEQFRQDALDYQRLKEKLRAEADAATAAEVRARDFTRAKMEEKLQGMIDNQLVGDESILVDTTLTPAQKWTLKAAKRARDEGMTVRLSKQAQTLMESEGYDDVGAPWTASRPTQYYPPESRPPAEVSDAAADVEAITEPVEAAEIDTDQLEFAGQQEDFPTVKKVDGKYEASTPDGTSLGVYDTQEAAMNRALKFYDEQYRAEEIAAVQNAHQLDDGLTRLLTDIRQLGGLRAVSAERGFKGELRAIADGLPAHLRLKLFRKTGKYLDSLREALIERGYGYETISDLLNDVDKAVRLLNEGNARGFNVTFSLAPKVGTPEFETWFGKSVMTVDGKPNGKPQVYYHGTKGPAFTDFDKNKRKEGMYGKAFFFSADKAVATGYGGTVIPVYLQADQFFKGLPRPDEIDYAKSIAYGRGPNVWVFEPDQIRVIDATFSLAPKEQTDMFSGGKTGGDTMFNLQGEEAQDFTGIVDKQAATAEAKKKAEADQAEITWAMTGIPQTPTQALQAQAARIQAKRQAATGQILRAIQAGQTVPKRAAAGRRTAQASLLARGAVPLTSRLAAIAPSLKTKMRRFEFGLGQSLLRDMEAVTPFLRAIEDMKDTDALVLDLALKNGDVPTRDALLNAYGMQAAFAQVEAVLAATRQRAIDVGYDVGEIADYFPRHVLDVDGLMTHYYGRPQAGHLELALAKAAENALAQGRVLTQEERIDVVNTALRGYGPKESKPSNLKTRKTDVVDMNANVYYSDPAHALVSYVESMNQAIAKRAFFGKTAQNVPPAGPGLASRINLEASIGAYVESLIATGEITRAQQREVSDLLESRFATQASSEFIKAFKTLGYITTMGKITSAITQVQDLAFSLYENGVFDTMVAAARATVKQSKITKKQLGLEAMAEEFRDSGKLAKLLNLTFKLTGLTYIDGIGKEAIVNAKFARMSRQARSGNLTPRTMALLERVFPPASRAQVLADLAMGKKTEDTVFAVYNVLADYQPISASEYPEAYLRHPNGRVFYMLKTFTLKQIDAFRREGITLIVHGNAKQKVQGFRNLTHLAALLFLVGMPVDWLKDFIMGRDPQLPDIAVDNVFKLLGVSRWNLWRFRDHKDPIRAAMELVTPPAPFLSYPIADVFDSAEQVSKGEEIKPGEFESWKIIPFFGDPVYWLIGGGRVKVEKRRRERKKEATGNRVRNR